MKLIPLNKDNQLIFAINKLDKHQDSLKKHNGNFGILTGCHNNIIAIQIAIPQLIFFKYNYDKKPIVICKDKYNPENVINMCEPGFLIFKCDNVDFEELNFLEFLMGIRIFGNNNFIPMDKNTSKDGIYICHGNIEEAPEILLDSMINEYKKLYKYCDKFSKFYSRFRWGEFYHNYIPDLRRISSKIYCNNEISANESGLFRDKKHYGYPADFLKQYHKNINPTHIIKKYCGESLIYCDNHMRIIEMDDGYYTSKATVKKITNWTANEITYLQSNEEVGVKIKTNIGKDIKLFGDEISSVYKMRRKLAKNGLFMFTKSDPTIYALMHALIEMSSKVININQMNFIGQ